MKVLYTFFILLLLTSSNFSQQVIFEEDYTKLPFPLRYDNSGIYSIASFDIANDVIYFSSFNNKSLFKYSNKIFVSVSNSFNDQKDFLAGFETNEKQLRKKFADSSPNEVITFKKNYHGGKWPNC